MATIPTLQIPGYGGGAPSLDFSPIAKLGDVYREAQQRRTLADLGAGLADGSINYRQAAGRLASTGNLQGVTSLLQLGEAEKKREAELAAGQQFSQSLSSLYGGGAATGAPVAASSDPRGIRNNNPLNLEASPFTQRQPGFSGSDGRFGQFGSMDQGFAAADNLLQTYAQRGINTIGGVIGRWAPANDGNPVSAYAQFVARKVGVDPNAPIDMSDPSVRQRVLGAMAEFENGRPVQVASADGATLPTSAQPAQGALPQAAPQGGQLSPRGLAMMRALGNPNLPAGQRDMAKTLLAAELDSMKLTNNQKEYMMYRAEGGTENFTDWMRGNKAAGASNVNVSVTGEKEYEKQSAKDFAEMNRKLIEGSQSARMKIATLTRLDQLLADPNIYTGTGAQQILAAKKLARAVGADVGDVSGPEAIQAIGNQFALELRNPAGGAGMPGALSDKDREFLQASVPGLGQTPEGNRKIVDYMKRVAQRSIDVERLRQDYVKRNRRLDEGFYRELERYSEANPLFPEANQPQQRTQMAPQDIDTSLANARAAIARNPAVRDAVIQRLRENGIDPGGL